MNVILTSMAFNSGWRIIFIDSKILEILSTWETMKSQDL